MSVDHFPDAGFLVIDYSAIESLEARKNSIYIWCNAVRFVNHHGLIGFCCGMFFSEIGETYCYGFKDFDWDLIDQSNNGFAYIVTKYMNEPLPFFTGS